MKTKIIVIVVLILGLLGKTSAQIPEYILVDLGTLGGNDSTAYGINNIGQVVGMASTENGQGHAFLYSNGFMQDLGTLGGDNSIAYGINNIGQVVGSSTINNKNLYPPFHAFLYSNGSMQDISGRNVAIAYGINNKGQVIGTLTSASGSGYRAFLYSDGSMKGLGTLGGPSSGGSSVNDNGYVVGWSEISSGVRPLSHAFLYSNGSMQDLGTLEGHNSSHSSGINNNGQMVGVSYNPSSGFEYAFLYSNGVMQNLGTLGGEYSYALGINDNGYVVGYSTAGGDPSKHLNRAFLYSNGSMRDLNNLIYPNSGWHLSRAHAINNRGQIVGYGRNPSGKWLAFLLNPASLSWRNTIEIQPVQPIYGVFPAKEDGKDSLVVVTHGWIPKEHEQTSPPNPDWVDDMVKAIRGNLAVRGLKNWQVEPYKWTEKAWVYKKDGGPETALYAGEKEGGNLGDYIGSQGWSHVHLFGHSAGAAVIQVAALNIKSKNINTVIHTTFLDPYIGFTYGGKSKYGLSANWADSYFVWDPDTYDHLFLRRTASKLDHAYNVDVMQLDLNKISLGRYRSTAGGGIEECFETVTSHDWPRDFYKNTIPLVPLNAQLGSEGFGFPLSKEGGNWDFALANYSKYADPVRVLGTPDAPCPLGHDYSIPVYPSWLVNFKQNPLVTSVSGIIQNNGNGLTITSGGRLQQQSVRKAVVSSEPAWIAISIIVTNVANLISFDAEFLSAKAQGLFMAYWETNAIGSIDERVVLSGLQHYTYVLPSIITNNSYTLGFRLDSFSNTVSSVSITNVSLSFVGIADPFNLSFSGKDMNGFNLLKLTGPSGFDYSIEASTNLIDWKTMAVLINTNGTVSFVDRQSTNSTARFYRAVGY